MRWRHMHHDAVIPDISAFGAYGGSVLVFQRAFPEAPLPWYDLSTGVNPFHYPIGNLPEDALCALPEAETLARLRQAAAKAYGCDASLIVAPRTRRPLSASCPISSARRASIWKHQLIPGMKKAGAVRALPALPEQTL
ncbi:MAG: hypothetical protein AAYR33_07100 [Acetobacteraceae bacterium]